MARKKAPKRAVKRPRKHTLERGVEDFAEEMGRLGERAASRAREGPGAKRLYRSGKEKILGGVCGGVAEYFKVDPVLIRLLWVLFALAWGAGVLLYIIAWIIIPRNPRHKW